MQIKAEQNNFNGKYFLIIIINAIVRIAASSLAILEVARLKVNPNVIIIEEKKDNSVVILANFIIKCSIEYAKDLGRIMGEVKELKNFRFIKQAALIIIIILAVMVSAIKLMALRVLLILSLILVAIFFILLLLPEYLLLGVMKDFAIIIIIKVPIVSDFFLIIF